MAVVTSSSTEAEIEAAYTDNASYVEDKSTAKAAAFITVCRIMLSRPSSSGKGTFSASWNRQALLEEIDRAMVWLEGRDTSFRAGPTVRNPSFRNFR